MKRVLLPLLLLAGCAPHYRMDEVRALKAASDEEQTALLTRANERMSAGNPAAAAEEYERLATLQPSADAFQVKKLQVDGPRKLFAMGFVTNLLNPKIAMLYLALLPQFIDPTGSVLTQSLALGAIQIAISVSVNAMIALAAGSIATFLGTRPLWLLVQRWLMGTVLAGLAVKMALEARR